jgi:CxxC motif-containing protein (DUF1111 family)
MKGLKFLVLIFSICVWTAGCLSESEPSALDDEKAGGDASAKDITINAFGNAVQGLDNEQKAKFVLGNSFFRNNWVQAPSSTTARDGLGVFFNARSCSGCHSLDGRGAPPLTPQEAPSALLFRISVTGTNPHGAPLDENTYGGQIGNFAIQGVQPEAKVSVMYEEIQGKYEDGASYSLRKPIYQISDWAYGMPSSDLKVSPRISPQMIGLGLLELISESQIIEKEDINDTNKDGISGKANRVWDESIQKTILGRFGWKANQPTLKQQVAGAFLGDIGITSPIFPNESISFNQFTTIGDKPNGGAPEISSENLESVVFYSQTLAVPYRRNVQDANTLKGKDIFFQLSCDKCHQPSFKTSLSSIKSMSEQTIFPYTDLLLHDMGEGLADHREDFLANGTEWRTPPLWGIGLIETVNQHTYLLHDGRARNVEEAILWHDGEASESTKLFKKLSSQQRNQLIQFVNSL